MENPELLRTLIDLVPDVVYFQDAEGRYRFANRAAAAHLGLSVDELLGRTEGEVFPEETAEMIRGNRQEIMASGEGRSDEAEVELPSGETRIFESRSVPLEDTGSGMRGVAGIVRDVTERHRTERELARAKEKYEAVFELNPVSLMVMEGGTGRILEVNEAFENLYGRPRQDVVGRSAAELEIFLDPEKVEELGSRSASEGTAQEAVVRVRRASGEVREVLLACVSLLPDGEVHLIVAGQDVSPMVEEEQALRRRAFHDALTGLPNRDLLWDRSVHAMERVGRTGDGLGVLYLDLDGFKAVNDTHGHAAGDAVLEELARRFSDGARREDTVARVGGDEFVFLLESVEDAADVEAAAGRLLASLDEPLRIPDVDGPIRLRASCGAVHVDAVDLPSPDPMPVPDRVDEILRRADEAMYAAKADGGGVHRVASYP